MARIPDAELARLKAEVSVERLVEGCGVALRKQGSDLVGACPFHDDSSPSLVVTPGKNLWHCLGACGRGGGPIDWVMIAQGVSFRHAVELLREASPALSVLSKTRPWKGTGPAVKSTRPKLPSLVEVDAADQELLNTVVGYYAETLATMTKRAASWPAARSTIRRRSNGSGWGSGTGRWATGSPATRRARGRGPARGCRHSACCGRRGMSISVGRWWSR